MDSDDDYDMYDHHPYGGHFSSGVQRHFSQVQTPLGTSPNTSTTPSPSPSALLQPKTFNDPIHGLIQVEHMLTKMMDTPYVQRLRSLQQLGAGSFVFHGAAHNRFQHSLGTMHLCGKMAEALRQKDLTGNIERVLTDKVILLIKAAGLGHDLGHGPFSHCFDGLFIPQLIKQTDDEELKEKLSNWEHEDSSEAMVEAAIREAGLTNPDLYEDYITDKEIEYVKSLINPDRYNNEPVFPELKFTYDIVSNSRCSIDVDKFDYLQRDATNAGLGCDFRPDQLIQNCKVLNDQICFRKKVAWGVYSLFNTRYSLFKQVYCHRKVKSVEYMLTDAMLLADPVLQIGRKVLKLDEYVKLNDSIIPTIEMYPVDTIANPEHREKMIKAQYILDRLRRRKLYKYCAESLLPPDVSPAEIKKVNEDLVYGVLVELYPDGQTALKKEDIIIQRVSLNYGQGDQDPVRNVLFYSSDTDTTAHHIPREKVSLLVPSRFSETYVRIYIKLEDYRQETAKASRALDVCLSRHLSEKAGFTEADRHEIDFPSAPSQMSQGHILGVAGVNFGTMTRALTQNANNTSLPLSILNQNSNPAPDSDNNLNPNLNLNLNLGTPKKRLFSAIDRKTDATPNRIVVTDRNEALLKTPIITQPRRQSKSNAESLDSDVDSGTDLPGYQLDSQRSSASRGQIASQTTSVQNRQGSTTLVKNTPIRGAAAVKKQRGNATASQLSTSGESQRKITDFFTREKQ